MVILGHQRLKKQESKLKFKLHEAPKSLSSFEGCVSILHTCTLPCNTSMVQFVAKTEAITASLCGAQKHPASLMIMCGSLLCNWRERGAQY